MNARIQALKGQKGFTLIELMIVVAIIGILAAIAVPQYTQYTRKAKFTEVVNATQPFKTAVELCIQDTGTKIGCSGGANGVPANVTSGGITGAKYVDTITTVD